MKTIQNSAGDDRYRQLVEAAPDAILVIDRFGLIQLANLEAENLFRCRQAELLGTQIDQFVPDRFGGGKHSVNRDHYNTHPIKRPMGSGLDLWARRADGTEVQIDINLSPIMIGEEMHVMCVVRDVTCHFSYIRF
jgi:PAS domain S-box-containing protein